MFRVLTEAPKEVLYSHQKKYIQSSSQDATEAGYVNIRELAEAMCRYDLDDVDHYWLNTLNRELGRMGKGPPWEWDSSKPASLVFTGQELAPKLEDLVFGTNQQSDQGLFVCLFSLSKGRSLSMS